MLQCLNFTSPGEDDWRHIWDYSFKWTSDHRTADEMRPMIFTYDVLAEEALNSLEKISTTAMKSKSKSEGGGPGSAGGTSDSVRNRGPTTSSTSCEGSSSGSSSGSGAGKTSPPSDSPKPRRDLYALLRNHADSDEACKRLWTQANTVPDWVDWEQIERGQRVFLRYAGPFIFALTFQSLVGGMGSRRVVETLARTGGFSTVTRRRLLETFQHVLQITRDLPSAQPGGDGFASTLRVRLLHASVRRAITRLAARREDYYDVASLGVPVNDLDSAGTIASFCATPLWVGLPRQGVFPTLQEKEDYVALWRWVAHVIGAPTTPFSTANLARATMESLLLSEIDPSDTSRLLANNVLTGLANQPPSYVSRPFLAAETYWLNGSTLAEALAVERPPVYYTALVVGQCLFFALVSYARRAFPSFDRASSKRLQKRLFELTVSDVKLGALGEETNFEFQYVPSLGKKATEMVSMEGDAVSITRGQVRVSEVRSVIMLTVTASFVALVGWLCVRVLYGFVGGLWGELCC